MTRMKSFTTTQGQQLRLDLNHVIAYWHYTEGVTTISLTNGKEFTVKCTITEIDEALESTK